MTRPRHAADSRAAIFAAAAAEFAAAGFAGASVDRIADRAGLNKAMIYYHFADKAALYREIVCDLFRGLADRVERIAAVPGDPAAKIAAAIDGLAEMAVARPHFPTMMAREIAEGGVHLDDAMLDAMSRVFRGFVALIREGEAARRFRPSSPALMYFTILAPLVFFMASAPVRKRLRQRLAAKGGTTARIAAGITDDLGSMLAHHKRVVGLALLAPDSLMAAVPGKSPAARAGPARAARKAARTESGPAPAKTPRPPTITTAAASARRRSATSTRPGDRA